MELRQKCSAGTVSGFDLEPDFGTGESNDSGGLQGTFCGLK
jgi:hypothetical protein